MEEELEMLVINAQMVKLNQDYFVIHLALKVIHLLLEFAGKIVLKNILILELIV